MTYIDAIYVITLRDLKRFWREKPRILGSVAMPALWLTVMGTGFNTIFRAGEVAYTQFMFPGIIAMTILFTSIFSSTSVIWDKQFGFMKEILVAPVPRTSIAVGKALSGSVQSLVQVAIILLFSPFVSVDLTPWGVVKIFFIGLLISFSLTSMGLVLAALVESHEGFNVIINFIVMPMFFLSGALFPIDKLPPWMSLAVAVDPLTYGVDLLRGTILGIYVLPAQVNALILAFFALTMNGFAVLAFNKRM